MRSPTDSPHPAFATPHPPDPGTLTGKIMLRIAASQAPLVLLQREVVEREADVDEDEVLLLMQDLVREHEAAVTAPSQDQERLLAALAPMFADHGIMAVASHLDRRGVPVAAGALFTVLPDAAGHLAFEDDALDAAVLTRRLVLPVGVRTGVDPWEVANAAAQVFRTHGLDARAEADDTDTEQAGVAVVLDDIVLADPRDADGALETHVLHGPHHERVRDVTPETFMHLLRRLNDDATTASRSSESSVRLRDGFGWQLEATATSLRFGHLRSTRHLVAPRGTDEHTIRLATLLLAGDVRALRTQLLDDPATEHRDRSLVLSVSPSAASPHPAVWTSHPPLRETLAGSLMLTVAAGLGLSYADLQATAVARAAEDGRLTPEQAILLLDDLIDEHDEAVDEHIIGHLRLLGAHQTGPDRSLVLGLPLVQHSTGRELALDTLPAVPEARGCLWAEREDFEDTVLAGTLRFTVDPASAVDAASQHLTAHGLTVTREEAPGPVEPGTAHLQAAPFGWAISHDTAEVRAQRRLWGPRQQMPEAVVDDDVTVDAVLDAVRACGRRATALVEVWTGGGWQLDIGRDVLRLTHACSPRVHTRPRPSVRELRILVADFLDGENASLLTLDWDIDAPGVLERRDPASRGPNMRMHPLLSLPHALDEGSFTGLCLTRIASGYLDRADVRISAVQDFLDDPEQERTTGLQDSFQVVQRVDELLRDYDEVIQDSPTSVSAYFTAWEALERVGIGVDLGAADASDGHAAAAQRALRLSREDPSLPARGYAFSHAQDLERAVFSGELYVGFGALGDEITPEMVEAIGTEVAAALRNAGLTVDWDGTAGARILVAPVLWVATCSGPPGREPGLRVRTGEHVDLGEQEEAGEQDGFVREPTLEEYSRLLDDPDVDGVELTAGSGWVLDLDTDRVTLQHHDAWASAHMPRPDRETLLALVGDLLGGDLDSVLSRDWTVEDEEP